MRPLNDNDRADLPRLFERELPEWLAAEQEAQRERESADSAKLGLAVLVILISGLVAMGAIAKYAGGLG